LEQRSLFSQEQSAKLHRYVLGPVKDANAKLCQLIARNEDLAVNFNLDEDVLLALKTFSRGSEMFVVRFDAAPLPVGGKVGHIDMISINTRRALGELKVLVSNKDLHIDDFGLSLTGVIAELQNRRRSTIAAELERIARFFEATAGEELDRTRGNVLNDTLGDLNAAFALMCYRDVLVPFKTALIELKLLPLLATEILEASAPLDEFTKNFKLCDATRILVDVQGCFAGLSHLALSLVGKLMSADLLLLFLRRHGGSFESGALDRAQQRASSNAHITGVLMNLALLQPLLEPFYNRTIKSLMEMKSHLDANLRMSKDGRECLSIGELVNVSENWAEVEIYFRDSGDILGGTEDIQRSVKVFQETGQFISSLSSHCDGSALSFTYMRGKARINLNPELLQVHVQWAVLGGDVLELEEFVNAFRKAQQAHAIRLELEEEGHPDHQKGQASSSATLGPQAVTDFRNQSVRWREEVSKYCTANARLLLLNRRSRVQLLLALRILPLEKNGQTLLPYVVECFPTLINERLKVLRALQLAIEHLSVYGSSLRGDTCDLAMAGKLMAQVQFHLKDCREHGIDILLDLGDNGVYEATRLDCQGFTATKIYCHHLSEMIRQNFGPALPGMVVWCERATTESMVRDLLLVAATPNLTRAVHVVGVDRLTPRIRELLLRAIEGTLLRCPLLLLFGDRNGMDTFAQYELENTENLPDISMLRSSLWASSLFAAPLDGKKAEVWVLAGRSGMGKSRWISINIRSLTSLYLKFFVHEGFSVATVIERCMKVCQRANFKEDSRVLALSFNVLELADFGLFSRFLHHLLALGLIIDEETGCCLAVPPNVQLLIYIELPEVAVKSKTDSTSSPFTWPPADGASWNAFQHPLLNHLPVLVVAVTPEHYISIREDEQFVINMQGQLVASYLFLAKNNVNLETVNLPTAGSPDLIGDLDVCLAALNEFFSVFQVSASKRVRDRTVTLLFDRFVYLRKIQQHLVRLADEMEQDALQQRMKDSFHNVLKLFMLEAVNIAGESKFMQETSVYTIRPKRVGEFEVLIATHEASSAEFCSLSKLFMESKKLIIPDGVIPAELRANVAPAFGIEDTSGLLAALRDCGHLLTPESLVRILYMNSRRMLGASVIYEGETGVGKSQNLKLYSVLINANTSIFTNLKLHLVAVVRAVGKRLQDSGGNNENEEDDHEEEFDSQGDFQASRALVEMSLQCSIEEVSCFNQL
jgi:hypothetical protein